MPRCRVAGLGFIIIPAGFNPPTGISNGVYGYDARIEARISMLEAQVSGDEHRYKLLQR